MKNAEYTRSFEGKDDDSVIPRFFIEAEPIVVDGETHYQDVEFVECIMPGNMLSKPVFRVTDKHRERWPNQYKAFKNHMEAPIDGIPLEEWPVLKPAQILELKSRGFRTVENIANMPDTAFPSIGLGALQLRQKALAYINAEKEMAITNKAIEDAAKFQRFSEEKDAQIERLNETIRQMGEQIRTIQQNQHLALQNIAATPEMQHGPQLVPQPAFARPQSAFASFANETPRSHIRGELAALNETGGPPVPQGRPQDTVIIAPNKPRRGRPPKAQALETAHG